MLIAPTLSFALGGFTFVVLEGRSYLLAAQTYQSIYCSSQSLPLLVGAHHGHKFLLFLVLSQLVYELVYS